MSISNPPQVLLFDVFGTVVEWRTCVTQALLTAAQKALSDPQKTLSPEVRTQATSMTNQDWLAIAEEWRRSYGHFTQTFDPAQQPFISVDEHHYRAIHAILKARQLDSLFTDAERWELALIWHRLEPWQDSVQGLHLLNRKFRTCTLSNGNVSLQQDLMRHGSLPFTDIASAEHFGAYKPSPRVYLGAVGKFGLQPQQCAMVAAHLHDLKAAKALGLQTVYVARHLEETAEVDLDEAAEVGQGRREGYVDMWVELGAGGFVEVARRFGISAE
ncbi:hypothetical protein FE257_011979 [Aspergillus nanangensis]|uniref:Haloacid dehalogenase, type II n=1 Tax=Aspergillus nanangensis TaxID=2582783 RepID=A0AAD4GQC1_ASPNN|nr:hypothetical protein FE257_011979 [Aspergillus nanangensis]